MMAWEYFFDLKAFAAPSLRTELEELHHRLSGLDSLLKVTYQRAKGGKLSDALQRDAAGMIRDVNARLKDLDEGLETLVGFGGVS